MLRNIGYKICTYFVDFYERKRTRDELTDNRVNPPEILQNTTEEWFKNGAPIARDQLPPRNRTIRQVTATTDEWDALHVENRIKNEHYRLDIVYKTKNIAFAVIIASLPIAYLIGQGISKLGKIF